MVQQCDVSHILACFFFSCVIGCFLLEVECEADCISFRFSGTEMSIVAMNIGEEVANGCVITSASR